MPFETQDVREDSNLHLSHGEQAYHKANSNVSADIGLQSPSGFTGDGNGSSSAQHHNDPRRGTNEIDAEADRMELEGEGQTDASVYECPILNHILMMNIIVWRRKGALKPSIQNHIRDLVQDHSLAILVVMETRVGGKRAKEITDRLPFDGAIHTDTIGYVRGL